GQRGSTPTHCHQSWPRSWIMRGRSGATTSCSTLTPNPTQRCCRLSQTKRRQTPRRPSPSRSGLILALQELEILSEQSSEGKKMCSNSRIRELNDGFRSALHGGELVLTTGVTARPLAEVADIIELVRRFSDFTPDNDPYGEHDFGTVEYARERFFWKI